MTQLAQSQSERLQLAYFSPFNPVQSGISDYSEELLPYLAHYADIALYHDSSYTPANADLTRQFSTQSYRQYDKHRPRYDATLFHMGNSAAHAYVYRTLLERKGGPKRVLVLHDFVLHHFLIGEYLNHGKATQYIALMERNYGRQGADIARQVIKGSLPQALFDYPLCDQAIEAADAVIVHSRYARDLIAARHPAKPVGIARMGVPLPPMPDKVAARAKLGLHPDEFIITSLGHLNPYKRLDSSLWAFRALSREFPNSRFVLVGSLSPNYNLHAMIAALGLERQVTVTGFASSETYADYLAASDVCLNLRYPTAGETSASLLRIMGAGRPVIVSRTGAFAELPDDTCIKLDVDAAEEELLLEYLRLLARRPDLAAQLGHNARAYVTTHAHLSDAAHDYYQFLCQVLNRPVTIPLPNETYISPEPLSNNFNSTPTLSDSSLILPPSSLPPEPPFILHPSSFILSSVSSAAAEIGIDENSPALEEVAEVIKFLED